MGAAEAVETRVPRDLVSRTVLLGRALRQEGVPVGPGEMADAVKALEAVGLADPQGIRLCLRAVLSCRPEDYGTFDRLFRSLWLGEAGHGPAPTPSPDPRRLSPPGTPRSRSGQPGKRTLMSLNRWLESDQEVGEEPSGMPSMSPHHVRSEKDFAGYGDEDMEAMERVARRIARSLARRPGRRWTAAPEGDRIHLRHVLRHSLSNGGEIVRLAYRKRRPRKVRLVVLCDVSGSMDLYARFLLKFLYALQNSLGRIETFAFSTRLYRITRPLREGSYLDALDRLAAEVEGWSGGTRIGECLETFNGRWSHLLDRKTVIVMLSDGWDTGEPEVLATALRELRGRARKVIWLNPLLGSPDYEPRTRGMMAALPHVDVFAPGHDLASLEELAREVVRG